VPVVRVSPARELGWEPRLLHCVTVHGGGHAGPCLEELSAISAVTNRKEAVRSGNSDGRVVVLASSCKWWLLTFLKLATCEYCW